MEYSVHAIQQTAVSYEHPKEKQNPADKEASRDTLLEVHMREHYATHRIAQGLLASTVFFLAMSLGTAMAQDGYYGQGFASSDTSANVVPVGKARMLEQGNAQTNVRESIGNDVGFAVPDTNGGLIWVPTPRRGSSAVPADARELRLKIRELASQLITGMDPAYRNHVALPTTFVNQENFGRTSTLGRFIAEQLFYEFNQRGFPVREYRLGKAVRTEGREGEFLLEHAKRSIAASQPGIFFVVGTYLVDRQAIFVNARLVQGNGYVVRTAQLVMPNASITRRMLLSGGNSKTASVTSTTGNQRNLLPIEDFKTVTQPTNLTPFEQGEDIH